MKAREKAILDYIIESQNVSMDDLLQIFSISRRTLYYDIENINFAIRSLGQIKLIDKKYVYVGRPISSNFENEITDDIALDIKKRRDHILYLMLQEKIRSIRDIERIIDVSRNTARGILSDVRNYLSEQQMTLKKDKVYYVLGQEDNVRRCFIQLLQEDNNIWNVESKIAVELDTTYKLELSDLAILYLSKFIDFIHLRLKRKCYLEPINNLYEAKTFSYYPAMDMVIPTDLQQEKVYLAAYISSLASRGTRVNSDKVYNYAQTLVTRFEGRTAVYVNDKDEFIKNLARHLQSSYYRIKFQFPVSNPLLDKIKKQYGLLFEVIASILKDSRDFPDFIGIRDEEIAFITTYFGSYLHSMNLNSRINNRVLIVCPHGLMTSKTIEYQINMYIPTIEIIGVAQINQIPEFQGKYDYIISTVALKDYENVLVVSPLLSIREIQYLANRLLFISTMNSIDINDIICEVKKYAVIKNLKGLKDALNQLIYPNSIMESEETLPMLQDLLNIDRIQHVKQVSSWEDAIKLASQPLLEDGSIEASYVTAMIESIKQHGPYIVLADEFALPHASSANGVKRLAMSLLVLDQAVDLLGKPVKMWMVLASIDNSSHMKALSSLTQLFFNQSNIDILLGGDPHQIMAMIIKLEKEVKL